MKIWRQDSPNTERIIIASRISAWRRISFRQSQPLVSDTGFRPLKDEKFQNIVKSVTDMQAFECPSPLEFGKRSTVHFL